MSHPKVNLKIFLVHIILGAAYGALWAVVLLGAGPFANHAGLSANWLDVVTERTTYGLWFGTPAGVLLGLISVQARWQQQIDGQTRAFLGKIATASILVMAGVIGIYSLMIDYVLDLLVQNKMAVTAMAGTRWVAAVYLLLILVPALFAVWFMVRRPVSVKRKEPLSTTITHLQRPKSARLLLLVTLITALGAGSVAATRVTNSLRAVAAIPADHVSVTVRPSNNFTQGAEAGSPTVLLLNADALVLSNDGSTATLTARVRDGIGNPVSGVTVVFQSSGGTTLPDSAPTNVEGVATSIFTANGAPGPMIITARANDLTQRKVIQVVKPGDDVASHTLVLEFVGGKLSLGQQAMVAATVRDAAGQPVADELVSFFGSLGEVSPASALSDGNGRVTVSYRAGRVAGQAMITALSGVVSASTTFQVGDPNTKPPVTPTPPTPTPTPPTPPTPPGNSQPESHAIYLPVVAR